MIEILHTSLAFVVAIALLIAVHEYGHFTVARRLGIRVEKFSIGFGPALFSWRSRDKEVLYVIAAIPLGGYVKMLGENPADQEEGSALSEQEQARAFHLQPVWKRAAVAVAGPAFNFVFAVFAYMLVAWLGQAVLPTIVGHIAPASVAEQAGLQVGDRVLSVNRTTVHSWQQMEEQLKAHVGERARLRVQRDEQSMDLEMLLPVQQVDPLLLNVADSVLGFDPGLTIKVDQVMGGSPAERAGLKQGDIIRQIDGWPVANVNQFIERIKANAGHDVAIVVRRDQTLLQLQVMPVSDDHQQVRIGVRLASHAMHETELYRMGLFDGMGYGFVRTWEMTTMTLAVFGKMVTAAISPDNLGGPIAIAQLAGRTADLGLVYFLGFLALISVNLGVLNLLPIPILDGGMLVYLGLEKLRGRALPPRFLEITQMIGLILIVSLMVFAFYNDISRLFRG
ncbi:MAG: RIP metalloprotease RseP [Zetaproteobacteria bacterium CG12_big_fil_rev_8_21_14_0_65_54_13]|nr:MAG: RIP metalloprotease RseP [Zetaproteobacteria bacterium CG23_combo_of_CG06-09_8_20_14_all_54_7]PIW47137.1 MAG: RIP metalloprotease RseP [Zetaproteobacteria bacterium CG12_big_fil_rev_8_21_14_0_65_54_13]PIX55808.1 MAG: RIP metalloprotease RseP [Zetaproteobacteria bacterium CG_4_10_14_3_um_filter_54_28]PJA29958.1 MAG: RIP metalloprotease RseP [Zetaproteobacteria bacterium CG_4_9_14_3_um_filter_54_145]